MAAELRRASLLRYALVGVAVVVLVGALAGIKFAQIFRLVAYGRQMEAVGPPPEAVSTSVTKRQTWERTLSAVGTVASTQSVVVSNQLAGVVERIAFASGEVVPVNALLVELNSEAERAMLASALARREQARTQWERTKFLVEQGVQPQTELDDALAAYQVADEEAKNQQARLDKMQIRAPFGGRLGIREVNEGQYLDVGSRITVLDAIGEVFVDFTIPQEEASRVAVGMPSRVGFTASPRTELTGKVAAIAPTVDVQTRHLEIRAHLHDPTGRLKPGMFVEVEVVLPEKLEAVTVPATAIVHASYGDSVFVVEPKEPGSPGMDRTPDGQTVHIARQRFVRVGTERGDFVQIEEGLESGAEVATAGAFKLRNGAPVVINNEERPTPQLRPTPENR